MQCLIFRLYGAMASWGSTAIGSVRPTRSAPSRSAVLGLLAAALGIRRDQEEQLARLNRSVAITIKCESEGNLLRDYHTAQVPGTDKKAIWPHRKAELENTHKGVNTILSTRDYRTDGHWLVAITLREDTDCTLEAIRDALDEPVFPLYLGRKSCPLSAPLHPVVSEVESIYEALSEYEYPIAHQAVVEAVLYSQTVGYEWEDGVSIGLSPQETSERWDEPTSRLRWQFDKRLVHSARLERKE
ncbi:type I-E CRISPR-associated protein Cas5/CasD [Kineobactrum salinum]|uniref:Type I-E CRISPR-associated protein Cas5/CasD n=1 Tax=Kineobactrum salinum TaxID=2708301 RepID=A0A6C0TXS7_9GAMM|nr:type I-E CRISPR-associated protein Cas5/CasD [Kineobactrum salinum]QIB64632.1 type I-E CRISPR-associated protein Cas5/CasD [Kineobactrum salinum]